MYIYKYTKTQDDSLIGYHLSTFCQVGAKEHAKRYGAKDDIQAEKQRQTICNNVNSLFSYKDDVEDSWGKARLEMRKRYFGDLTINDIELSFEKVEDVEINYKVHTIATANGEVIKTNLSLVDAIESVIK